MTVPARTAFWASWWCNPWQWAHPSWHAHAAEGYGLPAPVLQQLMASRPSMFLQGVGIGPSQPPAPEQATATLQWLELAPGARERALALVDGICFDAGHGVAENQPWCRALQLALRPASWLPAGLGDSRLLLGAWLGAAYWPRLRLAWPIGEVGELPEGLPHQKLETLWQGVMWRVTTQ